MSNWLPAHQSHMLYTIAHADGLIERMGDALYDYLQVGPFELESRVRDGREEVVVRSVRPIPEAVSRLASDALNQLRSAMEHALYAEVEHLMGRSLDASEAQAIEMPVKTTPEALKVWFNHKRLRTLPELQAAGILGKRVEALQPFNADDDQAHPLKVLAEHTNLSKHRMPAVAACMRPFMALQEPYKPGGASRFQGSGTPHLSGVRPVLVGECAPTRIVSLRGVPADALEELQELVDRHNAERLAKLDELSEDLATAYAVGGHHLATPVLRLVEHAGGLLQGLLLANVDMETMRRRVAPCFNLLYDVLMTSRLQAFAYRRRVQWVRRTVETGDSKRQIAVLRLYGLSALGK